MAYCWNMLNQNLDWLMWISFHESSNHVSRPRQQGKVSASFFFLLFRTLLRVMGVIVPWVIVKHFLILPLMRNCRILIGLGKQIFMNDPIEFLQWYSKSKLVPALFLLYTVFMRKKKFSFKGTLMQIWKSPYMF